LWIYFFAYPIEIWAYQGITFVLGHQLKFKKLHSHKANKFFYLMRKFQKVSQKIEVIGTYQKPYCPQGDNGPLGVNP